MSEQATACSRQLGPPEGMIKYAAALAGTVTSFQPSGSFKPTAMGSDLSETAVSSETANRHMPSDKSGSLSEVPDGANQHAKVAKHLPANRTVSE
jgi:hypothetical protein